MKKRGFVWQLTGIGLMAAVICILAPLSIPIGVVPISFATLAIYLALYVLGGKIGTLSCLVYLCIGLVGLPVFSGFTGGPGRLFGPTGGYLLGYVLMALIAGFFIDKFFDNKYLCLLGMVIGTCVCYLFGTSWLAYQAGLDFKAAFFAGVLPFIPGDLIKIVIAAVVGTRVRQQLSKAGINVSS